ncbi:hypothetical protein DYB32_006889 [Aphanomyces invadans]|uniref:Uncharacterized protein n=1 Tax=Aphanomyces invadans TaxID=157072 RepID=A0A3R6VMR1_9STRA|nr:hypothetical protein DYB32_006889 [Aphanomyces invadans]
MGCIDSKFKYEERQANAIAAFVHHAIDGKVDELAKAIKKDRKKVVGIDVRRHRSIARPMLKKDSFSQYGRTPASEVQTRLGKGNGAATIPEEAEPDLDQVFTLAGGTLPWEDTAVVPFDQTLPQNTTTTLASPRVAASDETPLTSLTGYDLLDAIFSLHDLVLTRDQGATVQFQQLVATHCFVALS